MRGLLLEYSFTESLNDGKAGLEDGFLGLGKLFSDHSRVGNFACDETLLCLAIFSIRIELLKRFIVLQFN